MRKRPLSPVQAGPLLPLAQLLSEMTGWVMTFRAPLPLVLGGGSIRSPGECPQGIGKPSFWEMTA